MLMGLATAAAAQTHVEGEIEAGYQGVSGDFRSAKFDQYRDDGPGVVLNSWFLLERGEGYYTRGWLDNLDGNTQEYRTILGRYGRYRLDLGMSQLPQTFSENALTPYGRVGTRLLLPAGFVRTNAAATLEAQLRALSGNHDLEFRQRDWTAGFEAWATQKLLLSGSYALRERDVTRPYSLNFGSAGGRYVNFRQPVDDDTHTWKGALTLLRERWNLTFDYNGSIYDNDVESVTVDNPTLTGATTLGRVSKEPDNSAHQFSLSAAVQLPWTIPARLAGTLSYGVLRQDESFLPHSVNPIGANPALPQSDLDGEINTLLVNFVFSARPSRDLSLSARYRYYDRDDNTDTVLFTERVRNDDASSSMGTFVAQHLDFRRQTAELEATYRLRKNTRVTAAYEWDNRYREDAHVSHQNDHALRLTLDYRSDGLLQLLRTTASARLRGGNSYDPAKLRTRVDSGLRRYDQADRDRYRFKVDATLVPAEAASLTLTGSVDRSNYDEDMLGLDDELTWTLGVDGTYQLSERASVTAFYTFDRTRWNQEGNGWRGRNTDKTHDLGIALETVLIPRVLNARFSWQYHNGKAETRTNPDDYPSIKDDLSVVAAMFEYRWRENVRLKAGYRFERWNSTDFKFDDLGLIPPIPSADVMLSNNVDDYDAHIMMGTIVYEF